MLFHRENAYMTPMSLLGLWTLWYAKWERTQKENRQNKLLLVCRDKRVWTNTSLISTGTEFTQAPLSRDDGWLQAAHGSSSSVLLADLESSAEYEVNLIRKWLCSSYTDLFALIICTFYEQEECVLRVLLHYVPQIGSASILPQC